MLFGEVLADIFPDRTVLGGAPFNVARHLKAFGQNPLLITRLGNDALRDEILDTMSQNGMDTLGVQFDESHPTGRVQVHIGDGGHSFDILPMQAYDFIHPEAMRTAMHSVNPVLVYFGTLAQRHPVSSQSLQILLNSTGAAKFLDINLRAPWYDEETIRQSLQRSSIVKLNADELDVLAGTLALPAGDPQDQAVELIGRFELEQAVVTCGEAGAWQVNRDGKRFEASETRPVVATVDTVGAGDGFSAVCILGTLLGWPAGMTLSRANAFAASICGIRGAVPQDAGFYKPFIEEWSL